MLISVGYWLLVSVFYQLMQFISCCNLLDSVVITAGPRTQNSQLLWNCNKLTNLNPKCLLAGSRNLHTVCVCMREGVCKGSC